MEKADLELVLTWRNHPEISRYMLDKHKIQAEEHQKWFDQARLSNEKRLLIFEFCSVPHGFVQFTRSTTGDIADWGFYLSPEAPKGIGQRMGRVALHYGFVHYRLHKICGQALSFNNASIRLHHRLGFRQEGTLRDQYFDGREYHALLCFGLLAEEWRT